MARPTYDLFVYQEAEEVKQTYKAANGRWPAASDLAHNSWRRLVESYTHEDILKDIWKVAGKEPPSTPRPPGGPTPPSLPISSPPKLRVDGTRFTTITGEPFVYKGLTAFSLIAQLARGDDMFADAYLAYAQRAGFNVVRTLTAVLNSFADLAPSRGLELLPRFLDMAAKRGLYVEVVGLSDTQTFEDAGRGFDWRRHARDVATVCAMHDNALFEFANEPYHGTHVSELHSMAFTQAEAAIATDGLDVLWAPGASPDDEAHIPSGRYTNRHLDRNHRDRLNEVRRVKALYSDVQSEVGVPCVNDEPRGADEKDESETGRARSNEPWFFFAMGALEAGFGVPGTFHCQDGLACNVPGPVQQECARAYLEGKALIADELQGHMQYLNNEHNGSPVQGLNLEDPGSDRDRWSSIQDDPSGPVIRAYSFIRNGTGLTVVLTRPVDHDGNRDIVWRVADRRVTRVMPHVQVYAVRL